MTGGGTTALAGPDGARLDLDLAAGTLVRLAGAAGDLTAAASSLGVVRLRDGDSWLTLDSAHAGRAETIAVEGGAGARYLDWPDLPGLALTVQVRPHEDGFAWRGSVEVPAPWRVEWLQVPSIVVPADLTGPAGPGRIVWPWCEGVLVDDLEHRERGWFARVEPRYPSQPLDSIFPGAVCAPFVAHLSGGHGVMLAAHDISGGTKEIDYRAVDGGIELLVRTYAAGAQGRFELDFDVVTTVLVGDWHAAADRYRAWFATMTTLPRLAERSDLPSWYDDSPLVLTFPVRGTRDTGDLSPNRLFPYRNALPHVRRIADLVGTRVLALVMHWEGTAPWAPPYVWPPYGGAAALAELTEGLHADGHLLGLYCSGLGWTQHSNIVDYDRSEEFAAEGWAAEMCLGPDGSLPENRVVPNQRSGFDLCPSRPRVAAVLSAELAGMLGAGVDYVQLYDQNSGGHSLFCYAEDHGHGPGPGRWQARDGQRLQRSLAAAAVRAGAMLGAEVGAGEPYLDSLPLNDLRFEVAFAVGVPIPLFQYCYHAWATNFMGNQVATHLLLDHTADPDNFRFRLAHAAHAGELLTLSLTDTGEVSWNWGAPWETLPDNEEVLGLVADLVAWRRGPAGPFWGRGSMTPPLPSTWPNERLRCADGSDLVVPSVLVAGWVDQDGRRADVLVNWTREDVVGQVNGGGDALALQLSREGGAQPVRGGTIEIPAGSVAILHVAG